MGPKFCNRLPGKARIQTEDANTDITVTPGENAKSVAGSFL